MKELIVPFKEKRKGFISIITPVLNGEMLIEQAINNVIDQKCSCVEHLIIDGGSRDSTLKISHDYANKYPHISIHSRENQNQSKSMNLGIKLCEGRIISFLNVDDYYEKDVFSRVARLFADMPDNAFMMANCYLRNDQNKIIGKNVPKLLDFKKLLRGSEVYPHPFNPSSYFYDCLLHEKVGFYDEALHFSMDLDFLIRASLCARVFYFPEEWGNFVARVGSKTYELVKRNQIYSVDKDILKRYWPKLRMFERTRARVIFECTKNPALRKMHCTLIRKLLLYFFRKRYKKIWCFNFRKILRGCLRVMRLIRKMARKLGFSNSRVLCLFDILVWQLAHKISFTRKLIYNALCIKDIGAEGGSTQEIKKICVIAPPASGKSFFTRQVKGECKGFRVLDHDEIFHLFAKIISIDADEFSRKLPLNRGWCYRMIVKPFLLYRNNVCLLAAFPNIIDASGGYKSVIFKFALIPEETHKSYIECRKKKGKNKDNRWNIWQNTERVRQEVFIYSKTHAIRIHDNFFSAIDEAADEACFPKQKSLN